MLKLCCASLRKKSAAKLTKLPSDEPRQSLRSQRSVNCVPLTADLYRKEGRYHMYHKHTFTLTDGKVSFHDDKGGFHESLVVATSAENEFRYEFIIRTSDKEHPVWHMRAESEEVWRQWVSYVDADGAEEASEVRLRSPTFNQAKMGKSSHVVSRSL